MDFEEWKSQENVTEEPTAEVSASSVPKRTVGDAVGAFVASLRDKNSPFFLQYIIAALVISFLTVSAVFIGISDEAYTDTAFTLSVDLLTFAVCVVVLAAALCVSSVFLSPSTVLPTATVLSVTVFCVFLQMGYTRNIWLNVGIALMCLLFCVWIFRTFDAPFSEYNIGFGFARTVTIILFAVFTVYMSLMGICRFRSFTYDTFDFGIFAQMFAYMKETGLPLTTVERGELLSHFAVHFSPFFYLLLPGYYVFSSPEYLCVVQTLFVALGVFAVYGIARHLGFSPKMTLLISALYLLYPALSFGLYYDFHENKFLTVFILFTVYFLLKRRFVPFYISALLLCTVKEDAAIYLAAIALFMLVHEKLYKHGAATLLLALAYFAFALKMVAVFSGEEGLQFGYRYADYDLGGGTGIADILKVNILNFGYSLRVMFEENKVEFLLWMFLPVLFMPFMTKRVSTLLLLMPMLLVNLMSGWAEQCSIDYQYTYGTAALIIVCAVLALRRISPKRQKSLITAAVMLCIAITVPRVITRNQAFINGYLQDREMFESSMVFIEETLDKDAAIGAEGNVIPVMYDYPNMVLDPRFAEDIDRMEFYVAKKEDGDVSKVIAFDLELYAENEYLVIYRNPNYAPITAE